MSVLGITDVWLYAAAVTVFVLIPGPGMLSLLTASAVVHARAGRPGPAWWLANSCSSWLPPWG